jgi:hypothetical protein
VERARAKLRRILRGDSTVAASGRIARGVRHRRYAAPVRQPRRVLPPHVSRGRAQDASSSSAT